MAKKDESNEHGEDFMYIVRIANTDIDGEEPVKIGLTSIKGVGLRTATAIADTLGLDREQKMGTLSEEDVQRIEEFLKGIPEKLPTWMLNRRKDPYTGEDLHPYSTDLPMKVKDDINFMKKIRCYKGIRHETHHKVRGQRTRSNGRKGLTLGVSKKRK